MKYKTIYPAMKLKIIPELPEYRTFEVIDGGITARRNLKGALKRIIGNAPVIVSYRDDECWFVATIGDAIVANSLLKSVVDCIKSAIDVEELREISQILSSSVVKHLSDMAIELNISAITKGIYGYVKKYYDDNEPVFNDGYFGRFVTIHDGFVAEFIKTEICRLGLEQKK